MGNLGNNLSSIFFSYLDDFFSPNVQVKRYYTSYLHLRLFVWESLISFHFLNFVFISHAIRHQYKRHVLFPKGELFVLFNFCIFHEWNWLYYFTKQKIWRSWYLTYWSNAYVIEWNGKIFYRLKNKAFCKRLKRWVEFLFFAQIYAVLNQKMFFSK